MSLYDSTNSEVKRFRGRGRGIERRLTLTAYLLVASVRANGDMRTLLLGEARARG